MARHGSTNHIVLAQNLHAAAVEQNKQHLKRRATKWLSSENQTRKHIGSLRFSTIYNDYNIVNNMPQNVNHGQKTKRLC